MIHTHNCIGDGVTQDGGHTPAKKLTGTYSLWVYSTLSDTWHPYYNQLTPVKSKYSHVFLSGQLIKCWFLIGLRAQVRLTCWKQGQVALKRVDTNPRLKFNRIINFSLYKCFPLLLFCVFWDYSNLKHKAKQYTENLIAKFQLKSKFSLIPG